MAKPLNKGIRRWKTREVLVGNVGVGGDNPIRIQSMTTTDTKDVEATVRQSINLANAGCEIVRITAPSVRAAKALKEIRSRLHNEGCRVPLVADIHFLPQVAMEAVEHVEKVRVNPGNYADRKNFQIREYTEREYDEELQRLHESFSPLVNRCKYLGRAMRIGTNHGSLSDRILNRYGDTPLGMVESALEFIRIAESNGFQNIILSMKASNPKVMVQAYRLAVEKMAAEKMNYPLHLGVTEAGDGEDGRIKSTVGIGSLLLDGYGDTIRVSLTEDPVCEIPVARELAKRAEYLWAESTQGNPVPKRFPPSFDPFDYKRRKATPVQITENLSAGTGLPPRIIVRTDRHLSELQDLIIDICKVQTTRKENGIEGLLLTLKTEKDFEQFNVLEDTLRPVIPFFVIEVFDQGTVNKLPEEGNLVLLIHSVKELPALLKTGRTVALSIDSPDLPDGMDKYANKSLILALNTDKIDSGSAYRQLSQNLSDADLHFPIWIRNTSKNFIHPLKSSLDNLLETSLLSGGLLCDGIGDLISVEEESSLLSATNLGYNVLQATRTRISKTEFVACPSCGRTLFDLETTTQKVKAKTDHLKGITIAIMGCIVNGPGEMADADFGYVGGAPGKINLYVGKDCVQVAIPEDEAVNRLIDLIKSQGKWRDPEPTSLT
ncbi:MAG: (E)-4-hydroxy-3-methylbut-2-enyl-diphosphate synthase [Opitutae bacterium]|nr:(E)-4-hydroxy-3-methylbut-2-enyl-diphosphate synthase [Opitutae bacterium]MBT5689801.1 (E)-4-hydroxy-3-methylbut-2-enyl-diphosphate synthase [Opitutae bacterium]MBT6461000.1 (E)-4-hydroxy-3-methylbut-2-enyl-diphosphate synthase [Opitutae bacterium]MBT7852182.1 (E)-4-hydroxy-3-methylbut-2-enyl-diphosphate synthase [Opitutae bacterium]